MHDCSPRSPPPRRKVIICAWSFNLIQIKKSGCGVSGVCKELPETVPATGSNCKSRDYRRVCYPNGSTPRMWGIGSPSTRCLSRCLLLRTKGHRHRHGLAKFQTTSPPQVQRHQTSVSQGFSAQRASPRVSYLSSQINTAMEKQIPATAFRRASSHSPRPMAAQ